MILFLLWFPSTVDIPPNVTIYGDGDSLTLKDNGRPWLIMAHEPTRALAIRNKKYNDETKQHFDILLPKYPKDHALIHAYGTFCREQLLDFQTARESFERCVELEPNNVIYRLSLASVLINDLRMYDSGREQLLIADRLQPGNKKTLDALKRLQKKKFQGDKGPKKGFLTRFAR